MLTMQVRKTLSPRSFFRAGILALVFLFAFSIAQAAEQRHDDLFSVAFAGAKEGWASGYWGTILHSGDGGRSWTQQSSGTNCTLTSIHFVDDQYGWAVGDQGTILATRDGGRRWFLQKSPVALFLMGVTFVNRLKGWAVGERTTILATEDGGLTWKVQFKDEDFVLKSVSFSDERNGWAVGEYGYIYHTTDGGRTWKREAGKFGFSEQTGLVEGGKYLFGLAAVDRKTAYAVGIDGCVTMTTDGKTWHDVVTGAPKAHLFGIAVDKSGGIAIVGKGVLMSSADGGRTWRKREGDSSIDYGWLYGISTRGTMGMVAVGAAGIVYLTDNGSDWARVVHQGGAK